MNTDILFRVATSSFIPDYKPQLCFQEMPLKTLILMERKKHSLFSEQTTQSAQENPLENVINSDLWTHFWSGD